MKAFNLLDALIPASPDDPEGFVAPDLRFTDELGTRRMTARLYEMEPGNSNCPYHYEYGTEEWLLLLRGELTVRVPDGEVAMRAGDILCFPEGPEGAHRVTAAGSETARFLFISTTDHPQVAVYPDSDKIGVWPTRDDSPDQTLFHRPDPEPDYWEGEL